MRKTLQIIIIIMVLLNVSNLPAASILFTLASSPGVGSGPHAVTAFDVNGDGHVDLISANGLANTISVMTNNGTGGFALSSSPGTGSDPSSIFAADMNGDGRLDVVAADYYGNSLSVLTNNGTGSFATAATPGVGSHPTVVVAADVNGDGKVDLIVANSSGNTLSVVTNNGNGGFVTAGTYTVGNNPVYVTASDVNGDGKVDLICANANDNTITVLTNNGSGGFVTNSTYAVGVNPREVAAGDVNGDGKVDLIVANFNDNTVSVLTNNGTGGFKLAGTYPVNGSNPTYVTLADINGDGWRDIITANNGNASVSVLTNNGTGGFGLAATNTVGSQPEWVTTADVNGDGKPDIITANYASGTLSVLINGSIFPASAPFITAQPASITNQAGTTATFTVTAGGTTPLAYQWSLNTTNIAGATNATLSLANVQPALAGNYSVAITNLYGATNSAIAVLTVLAIPPVITAQPTNVTVLADGTATFTVAASGIPTVSYQWTFDSTNIIGATNATLILTNVQPANAGNYAATITNVSGSTNSVTVALTVLTIPPTITFQPTNQTLAVGGTATFTVTATGTPTLNYQWSFNTTNIAGATNATLSLANVQPANAGNYAVTITNLYGATNSVTVALTVQIPPISFTLSSSPGVGSGPHAVTAFDVNGDGHVDLISANGLANTISVMTNNGTGGFALSSSPGTGSDPSSIFAADMNGDGRLDVVAADYYGNSLSVLTNNGTGSFATAATPGVGSHPTVVVAADVNGDGKVDLIVANSSGNTLSVVTNNGNGGFVTAGTYTVGNNPVYVTASDVNGDGKVDLICANANDNTITVLTNNGSGGFVTNSTYAVGVNPREVAAGDVNGDGKVDLIVANFNDNTVSVLTNNGTGGFKLAGTYPVNGSNPTYVTLADINGDGWRDIITANNGNASVSVLTNNGTGGFGLAATNTVGSQPEWVTTADVNGDGKPDIITANYASGTLSVLINGSIFPASAPFITAQPASITNQAGTTATFTVTAGGTTPLAYQWSLNTTNIAGATNATLSLANVQPALAGNYSVTITNLYGSTNSATAVLTVLVAPVVTTQPQSQTVLSFNSASFTVTASGTAPLSYQWQKNGTNLVNGGNISGSATTNLNLASVSLSDAGNYDVVVSNPDGTTNSMVAVLTVPQTVLTLGSTNAMSGTTVMVPVLMNALGVENSFEGSISFDSTKLVLQSIQTGQATAGDYLAPVYTYTNSGYVGFAFFLSQGATLPAGTQEVAELIFQTLPVTNSTTANVTFGDYPDGRQLLDNNLDSLPASYQGGTVSLVPAEYEADVYPRTNGDSQVNLQDWGEEGRMVAGLDVPTNSDELLRADCAPRGAPDGVLTVADWVQAGRYALHLDPLTLVPSSSPGLILDAVPPAIPLGSPAPSRILQISSVTALRGQTASVPVLLVCTTNENAVGLTVDYNTNLLQLAGVSLGSAFSSGRLNVNSNLLGQAGITLALLPGSTLAAGTNQVAILKFTTSTNASGTAPLTLDTSVVQLQVADVTANPLATSYVNGAVVLPPQPVLAATVGGGTLQLTWQTNAGTFQVLTADSLLGPWNPVVLPLVTNNANVTATVTVTNQQQYFRLQGQ